MARFLVQVAPKFLPFAALLAVLAAFPAAAGLPPDPGAPAPPPGPAVAQKRGVPAARMPINAVYRRADGTLHLRVDATRSVPVELDRASGMWMRRGDAHLIDPTEIVHVVDE